MQLTQLLRALPTVLGRVGGSVDVDGIVADSRDVDPGDLFIAIPGVSVDGHKFIADAVDDGAVAVVGERPPQDLGRVPWGAFTYVRVPDARKAWGWLCAAWNDFPSRKMTLLGVTGTDGKTTTVSFLHAIFTAAGLKAGLISTVAARVGAREVDTGLHTTTPDPPDVQGYLKEMVENGVTHAVMEVTSHGLAQHRVAGCDFDVAVVTNITHEHLDYHGSYEAYREAKALLFKGLSRSFRKPGVPKVAVLNVDDDSYGYLVPIPADEKVSYGLAAPADVRAREIEFGPASTRFVLELREETVAVELSLVGAYNVSNALAAAAAALALDVPVAAIVEGLGAMEGVPGRMERIDEGQDFLAIVDFAHTPNALKNALAAARKMTGEGGRVIVVFGSAGLRDREKRVLMGQIAGELADRVIVTAEDPRTEPLNEIIEASVEAARSAGKVIGQDLWAIPDRGRAILKACQMARPGDVVIACGKGHEQSMCFGTTEYPWDDREAMRQALNSETLDTLPTAGSV